MADYDKLRVPGQLTRSTPGGINGMQGYEFWDSNGLRIYLDTPRTAMRFYDAAGNQRILIDGVAVLMSFSDGTRDRVQIGNLAAYTDPDGLTSAGGYGGRAVTSDGRLIWDTDAGAIGALKSLGISSQGPGQTVTSTSFIALTPSMAITFTLTRPARCMFYFFVTAKSTVAAKVAYARLNIASGPVTGASGNMKFGGGGGAMDVTNAFGHLFAGETSTIPKLTAGTYTVQVEAAVDAGGSMYFDQGYVQGFLLGS
jgi:hypothetical protein